MLLSVLLSLCAAALCLPSFNSTTSMMPNTSTGPPDGVSPPTTNVTAAQVVWLNSTEETVNTTTRTPTSTEVTPSTTTLFSSNWTPNETSPERPTADAKLFNNTEALNTTFPFDVYIKKDDLLKNPGLVAVTCIFCILLALVLFVGTVKCMQAPKSDFERLEEVPLGKVTEESPFAHYSK